MLPQKTYYPWYDEVNGEDKQKSKHRLSLSAFLDALNLHQFYETLRRSYNITEIKHLSSLQCSDLLNLGMTSRQVNLLVDRLLDVGLAPGYLLSDSADLPTADFYYAQQQQQNQPPQQQSYYVPQGHAHRPIKLFRKLFQKKTGHHHYHHCYSSAPVSPLHAPHPVGRHGLDRVSTPNPDSLLRQQDVRGGLAFRPYSTFEGHRQTALPRATANPALSTSEYEETAPPLACIIPEQDIRLHDRIGLGSFGIVRRADWNKPSGEVLPVAVKLLRPDAVAGDLFTSFLDELRAMQCLSHPNLIRLHGVVLSNPIMLVTELAPLGSLLLHLRAAHWRSVSVGHIDEVSAEKAGVRGSSASGAVVPHALQADSLWDMAVQVARGMAYLSSRGLVHRDLASRNILLASVRPGEFPLIKIGDFGLVRFVGQKSQTGAAATVASTTVDRPTGELTAAASENNQLDTVYVGRQKQRIPFAWCAPESLGSKRIFSQASDVWSWAVTCWEMWTGGAAPWTGLDASQLFHSLQSGHRLTWPRLTCPRRLYQLMLACWRWQPHRRPTFAYLASRLDAIRPFEVIAEQNLDEADRLGLEIGDVVVVIDGCAENFWWRGQNRRTGEIGSFPRAIVRRASGRLSGVDISRPDPRSLVHTGHLAANGQRWGNLDKLDVSSVDVPTISGYPDSITYAYSSSLFSCRSSYQDRLGSDKGQRSEVYSPQCLGEASSSLLTSTTSDNHRYDDPDDDNDERILLDSTAYATIGAFLSGRDRPRNPLVCTNDSDVDETISSMKSSVNDTDVDSIKKRNNATVPHSSTDTCLLSDLLEFTGNMILRAPPGPDEGEGRQVATNRGHEARRSRHASGSKSLPVTGATAAAATLPSNLENRNPTAGVSVGDQGSWTSTDTIAGTVEPSAPPLIDLYSPVVNPVITGLPVSASLSGLGLSATTCSAGFRPVGNPQFFSGQFPAPLVGVPTAFPHPMSVRWTPGVPTGSSAAWSSAKPGSNPFDSQLLDSLLPNPSRSPIGDAPKDARTAGSTDDTVSCVPPLSRQDGVSTRRCEKEVLVSRAADAPLVQKVDAGAGEPSHDGIGHPRTSRLAHSVQQQPQCRPDGETVPCSDLGKPEAPAVDSCCGRSDEGLGNQLAAICAQVPGSSLVEARHALAFLLNPFVPVAQYLERPALPSAPPTPVYTDDPANTVLTSTAHSDLVPLAVRFLLANRLASLGMSDWLTCCRVLTIFQWNLASAADWLAERLPGQHK